MSFYFLSWQKIQKKDENVCGEYKKEYLCGRYLKLAASSSLGGEVAKIEELKKVL